MSTELFSAVSGDVENPALPVVALCHGSMDRSAGMLRLGRQLERDLDQQAIVVRYDRRGYAKSAGVGPPYALVDQIDDLESVLDRHVPGRPVRLAFGHSFGGNVVLGLAARRPKRIERVAVYETPLSWFEWWPTNTAGGAAAQSPDPEAAAEAFMRRLIGDERWERLPAATRAGRCAEGAAMMGELTDLRRAAPWAAGDIVCPVLAIGGEHGRPHHQRGMQHLAEMLETGTYHCVPGAGHGAPNTHPGELATLLVDWFGRAAD